ncbi:MAG: ATP-binding protein [Anaerolineae bacterium]|nr:ATP-binding protein [Anaerolineae bacterium]
MERLYETLQASSSASRAAARPAHLRRIAAAEADAFLAFLADGNVAAVKAQGAQRAEQGLGTSAMLRMCAALRQFCQAQLDGDRFQEALAALDEYAAALVESFVDAREAIIVAEQEHIRAALQRELEDLYESEREHRVLAEALRDSAAALNSTLDLNEVLDRILTNAARVVPHDAANIMFVEGGVAFVVREHGYITQDVDTSGLCFPVAQTPTLRHMTETGQPVVIPDVRSFEGWVDVDDELWIRSYAGAPIYIRSYAGAPIRGRSDLIGFLSLDSTRPNAFAETDVEALRAFADQAAVSIENARLYRELEIASQNLEQMVEARTAELRRLKESVETIINNSPDAILFVRTNGSIEATNRAVHELSGFEPEELIGRPLLDLMDRSSSDDLQEALLGALNQGTTHRLEATAQRKDGATFDANIALAPVVEDGVLTGLVCSLQDISALKEVTRMKDAFVSNVSHELRTPIANIKLYHDLLERNPGKGVTYMAHLKRETARLSNIVEDLLLLSRLDQGRVALKRTPINLNDLAVQYVTDRTLLAESRGLILSFSGDPDLPDVQGDPSLLGQALGVLLTNAFNYTSKGGKVFVSTQTRWRDEARWITLAVGDTGPGISVEEQRHIFDRFFRGDAAHETNTPGTGLGLAIAREIVERHRGKIEVISEGVPGKGTTFVIWLPVSA